MLIKWDLYVTTYSQAAQAQKDGKRRWGLKVEGRAKPQDLEYFCSDVFKQSYTQLPYLTYNTWLSLR
jgi:hypothetical protein